MCVCCACEAALSSWRSDGYRKTDLLTWPCAGALRRPSTPAQHHQAAAAGAKQAPAAAGPPVAAEEAGSALEAQTSTAARSKGGRACRAWAARCAAANPPSAVPRSLVSRKLTTSGNHQPLATLRSTWLRGCRRNCRSRRSPAFPDAFLPVLIFLEVTFNLSRPLQSRSDRAAQRPGTQPASQAPRRPQRRAPGGSDLSRGTCIARCRPAAQRGGQRQRRASGSALLEVLQCRSALDPHPAKRPAAMADLTIPLRPEEKAAPPMHVCVTGATGYVAGHIVARLLAAGHTVGDAACSCRRAPQLAPCAAQHQGSGCRTCLRWRRASRLGARRQLASAPRQRRACARGSCTPRLTAPPPPPPRSTRRAATPTARRRPATSRRCLAPRSA